MPPSANFRTFQTGPGNMPVYCAYHGLMVGYGDGLFGAEDPVTPAAACTVILRYLALTDLVWDYNSACSTACDLGLSEACYGRLREPYPAVILRSCYTAH